ncbi:MAG: pilus assembly protein [Thermoleophilia bacterium]|nr:pilus assembly protein [Thermoleophilia bacterium]
MPPTTASRSHGEDGTASVELVAVIPFLLFAVVVVAQAALAGHALWSASVAARAGARAALVGGDAEVVARRALPAAMRPGATVEDAGVVSVRVRVPSLLGDLPPLRVGASSGLEPDGG